MTPQHEQEWREEAERLKDLDAETQRQVIDLHRSTANDTRATRADRRTARERAEALERFLGFVPSGKPA
jgi:hypothetical protein